MSTTTRQTADLSGRAVLVVGATSGIGRAAALAFAQAGASVVVSGLGAAQGRDVESEIRSLGREALYIETDVSRESEVRGLMQRAVERFGRIHAAVNNAGTEGRYGPVQDMTVDDFERIIGVNLRGIWLGLKYQIPHMLGHGGGAIVNTSSTAGVAAIPNIGLYTASKHAVIGLTKASALEVARSGIRINAVAPGPVETGLLHRMVDGHVDTAQIAASVPMGRISSPEEIAQVIVWLCSDAASYVTGHTLVADGGLTAA